MNDAAGELLALTRALEGELRRARRRGVRALPSPPAVAGASAATSVSEAPPAPAGTSARPAPAPPPIETPEKQPLEAQETASSSSQAAPGPNVAVAAACGDLASLRTAVAQCTACGLCEGRTQTVFADGEGPARVMFVGEAPGYHEDQEGVPFVGAAGQLLTDIVQKGMGLARSDVYIANVLKCRPPENRDPTSAEKALCTPFLDRQVELVNPDVIIPLGRHAAGHVLGQDSSMSRMRGKVHRIRGRAVVPTFHPAYLLRTPSAKRECWQDIQLAMSELGIDVEKRS